MRDEMPDMPSDDMKLDAVIRTLRELPPENPVAVERIVAAARAHRGSEVIPNALGERRRSLGWHGIGLVAAATLVFGVGFVAGHFKPMAIPGFHEPQPRGINAKSPAVAQGAGEGSNDVGIENPSDFAESGGVSNPSAASLGQLAAHGNAIDREMIPIETAFRVKAPSAKQVSVVGDFNAWNPSATPLKQGADNVWTGMIPLRPGRHTYAFMIDGRIVPDPRAVNVRDPDYDVIVSTVVVKDPEE